jgi:hypothetical protein
MLTQEIGPITVLLIYIAIAVGIANVLLLIGLINVYWKTYKKVKSKFTIGLLYFASFLLIQNILVTITAAIPLLIPVVPYEIPDYDFGRPHIALFFINLIQLVALSILYRITKE